MCEMAIAWKQNFVRSLVGRELKKQGYVQREGYLCWGVSFGGLRAEGGRLLPSLPPHLLPTTAGKRPMDSGGHIHSWNTEGSAQINPLLASTGSYLCIYPTGCYLISIWHGIEEKDCLINSELICEHGSLTDPYQFLVWIKWEVAVVTVHRLLLLDICLSSCRQLMQREALEGFSSHLCTSTERSLRWKIQALHRGAQHDGKRQQIRWDKRGSG